MWGEVQDRASLRPAYCQVSQAPRTTITPLLLRLQACDDRPMARALRLTVAVAGLAVGALSLAVARHEPAHSFGGDSALAGVAELLAGYALLAVGLVASSRGRERRLGAILVAASLGWFLLEWNNPGAGSAFVFSIGLALYVTAPPLVAHAILSYPDGRLRSWPSRVGLAFAYADAVLVLGVLAASVFAPAASGCAQCPRNLLLVDGDGGAYEGLNRVGVHLALAWALLLILLVCGGLVRSTPARRRIAAPVVAAGCAFLGLVAADFAHSLGRGFLSNDRVDRRLWLAEAAALCALALGVAWAWVRARRTRSEVARLVVELAGSPPPGGLRDVLAATLHDPSLELAYRLGVNKLVDARGHPVQLEGEVTPLVRGAHEVALLAHRPGLLDDPTLVEEVAGAARLALENELLQAETRAQLEDLRASRARIIETGDAERRRLERDLHDGAQQRLVTLSLALRLARSQLGANADPVLVERIDEAEQELRAALAELRELAHGIFPAVLAEEGLAPALEALVEEASIPIEITALPDERVDPVVEAAGYFVVSETVRRGASVAVKVSAARRDRHLVVEVEADDAPDEIVDLEDRVGALDGRLEVVRDSSGRVTIRAEIPCES
jgi:signal transduction histidine kinase